MHTTFKKLRIGQQFIFSGEDTLSAKVHGTAQGPWRKTGPTRYVRAEDYDNPGAQQYRVGTRWVEVETQESVAPGRLKWTVYASGGRLDNPWDSEKEVLADSLPEVLRIVTSGEFGLQENEIDGIIRSDIIQDFS